MIKTLGEIAEKVGGELLGEPGIEIRGVSGIREAKQGDITFLANPRYEQLLDETGASAVLVPCTVEPSGSRAMIRCENPSLAFAAVVEIFNPAAVWLPQGVHPSAVVDPGAVLEDAVSVGPLAVIGKGAQVGSGSVICGGAYIGPDVRIGRDCLIHPNVSVLWGSLLGDRVIIHSGTVIGSDGFGYATIEGVHHKIPQVGIVVVEDDVEIGANVTVDRARFDRTVIGRGTKIDNLVQIAHNVIIGENSILVAQVAISGSTRIGNHVTLAGQVGVVGHIEIGDGNIVAAQSGVSKDLPPGKEVWWGTPVQPIQKWKKMQAMVRRLPDLNEKVKLLEKRIGRIENGSEKPENA